MANKPAGRSKRTVLVAQAKGRRAIAVHTRELAAHVTDEIDEQVYIARAEELEKEATQLEAEANKFPEDPY